MNNLLRRHRGGGTPDYMVILLLLSLLVWAGCSADLIPGPEITDNLAFSEAHPQVRAVMEIQDRHTDDLLSMPGVVGTATRLTKDGKQAIVVYVLSDALAKAAALPEEIEEVPVVVEVTGMFVALSDPTTRQRPAPLGFSVGHPEITAGTIGCRVKDGSGNVYVLSNNHVLANIGDANIGDSALQPGPFDGGTDPADKIGELFDFEPLDFGGGDNTIDAAIAISSAADLDFKTPSDEGYGTPNATTVPASLTQPVQKYGRTTRHTHGQVSEINVTVNVCYECAGPFCFKCKKLARFVDQIAITDGEFSAGGDSGSLIVTDDPSKNPVGLLFAGSSTRTLANRIDLVLTRFNVTVDDGSGVTNNPPTASFTSSCTDLTCDFDGAGSSDSDGSIASYDWDFGDGNGGTGITAMHPYGSAGTYTVMLTVTDDDGATGSESQEVTVSSAGGGITVTDIVPNTAQAGTSVDVTITGTGFTSGAEVTFENGSGPTPTASSVVVVDENTITATVTVKNGGPPRNRVWDVRVTNQDASSGVLVDGFTINP